MKFAGAYPAAGPFAIIMSFAPRMRPGAEPAGDRFLISAGNFGVSLVAAAEYGLFQ